MASVVRLAVDGRVQRVQQCGVFAEPGREFAYASPVGIVEVLLLTKQFDSLGAASHHGFEVIDLQPFAHPQVGGNCPEHQNPEAFP